MVDSEALQGNLFNSGLPDFIGKSGVDEKLQVCKKMLENEQHIRELARLLNKSWADENNHYTDELTGEPKYALSAYVKGFIFEKKLQYPDIVIAHINNFGSVTNKYAGDVYGIRHLPDTIRKIKKRGYVVKTRPIEVKDRYARATTAVEYYFDDVVTPLYRENMLKKCEGF